MRKLGPEGKRLLQAGDRFDPPAGARGRVGNGLARKLGAATLAASITAAETSAAAGAAPVAGWTALGIKAVAALAIGGALVGGGVGIARRLPQHSPAVVTDTTVVHRAPPAAVSPAPTPAILPERGAPPRAPLTVRPIVAPAAISRAAPTQTSTPSTHEAEAHVTPRAASEETPMEQRVAPQASASPELGAEVALLRDVQVARTSGDPGRALALLGRYAQEHPAGALHDVATTEQVLALCALGRASEARALARPLFDGATMSPLTARLRNSCATKDP